MVRISRQQGEAIILYQDDPTRNVQLGQDKIELRVKRIHHNGKRRVELAISAPKRLRILRRMS